MAATAPMIPSNIADNSSVKTLAESSTLSSVPSHFAIDNDSRASHCDSIPIIDFSLLVSDNPDHRAKGLRDLDNACREWGFFVLVNHGISESLLKDIVDVSLEYFELPEEDKRRYEANTVADPITSGTGSVITMANQKINLWRDFVTSYVHPKFHCPPKPHRLREVLVEYSEKTRSVVRKLLQAIGENLELEKGYIDEALKLNSCYQLYAAHYYPPCPQPDQAMGIPTHTDHGLLTLVVHNGVAGLQIQHNGEWFNTNSPQNSFLVNTADHLEIFSNGRYKSVTHRAVVNNEASRISVVMANGSAPDAIVGPAEPLVERDGRAYYRPLKFLEYVENKRSYQHLGKTILDSMKIQDDD
ncbi:putative 2-oxoglutarate-dependent dioxygenase SLC1 [Sesamum alatum]|uniref:2-oxoglutarate-dependent dioxygenase SLC1 n=1 Tax=Sesamum alatum TaxID=300844 RepID=A0AAE1YXL0_9LAMI|nr:putative 2-oxoglutarate-dependent dioxygenase SLC1 [Sesamum alatum]KAK4438132.1 putative 2-oxoglutarate-dependent dioxygenase SLC1 [Sesamum alatum]